MTKWISEKPTKCDLCNEPLNKIFVDGKTVCGYWAIMCRSCHKWYGTGLGLGKGRKYDLETLENIY